MGKSDRTKDGYNITHTYDQKGLVLFEGKNKPGHINEFQIYFSHPNPNEVSPKGIFVGNLKIDGLTIYSSLDSETMLKKLKKWKKTDSYIEHSYRMQFKMTYIYFQFADDEKTLIKVSIGQASTKA
ncbi:MAG: hypothetical protein NT150_05110 [Bacteroidetes bacterium]|nr:hypothetical protein [Bacteroidota bacterium]